MRWLHSFLRKLRASTSGSPRTSARSRLARQRKAGRISAAAILALRTGDGSELQEPRVGVDFLTSDDAGKWRQDPISHGPLALGAHWAAVKPFVLESSGQFRVPPPPALDSPEYAAAFNE